MGYKNANKPLIEKTAWIVPEMGSNLCRLTSSGHRIIDYDAELLSKGDFTGTPVLYPIPNRIRNGVFPYGSQTYNRVKRGVSVFEHGLVYDEPWQ
ncbi:hypothetical protein ES703_119774 [subsurface metagenome]